MPVQKQKRMLRLLLLRGVCSFSQSATLTKTVITEEVMRDSRILVSDVRLWMPWPSDLHSSPLQVCWSFILPLLPPHPNVQRRIHHGHNRGQCLMLLPSLEEYDRANHFRKGGDVGWRKSRQARYYYGFPSCNSHSIHPTQISENSCPCCHCITRTQGW